MSEGMYRIPVVILAIVVIAELMFLWQAYRSGVRIWQGKSRREFAIGSVFGLAFWSVLFSLSLIVIYPPLLLLAMIGAIAFIIVMTAVIMVSVLVLSWFKANSVLIAVVIDSCGLNILDRIEAWIVTMEDVLWLLWENRGLLFGMARRKVANGRMKVADASVAFVLVLSSFFRI